MKCDWCMTNDHAGASCPQFAAAKAATEHGIVDPMTADDVNDHLALRMFRERAAKGQYRRLCLEAGIAIPPEVLDLDPDNGLYAA